MLEQMIRNKLQKKPILLMTHLVLGYPSIEENHKQIEIMAAHNVDLIELQIPFSEPSADGPRIAHANHQAIDHGFHVHQAFEFAQIVCENQPHIGFLFMTYYNILFKYGLDDFCAQAQKMGIKGLIVPDIPPEESQDFKQAAQANHLDTIFIFTPTSSLARLKRVSSFSSGLVYGVGRKGVTGQKTKLGHDIEELINTYRQATNLPLALGFGLQDKTDIDFLSGKVDIAVMGSKLLQVYEEAGSEGLNMFFESLSSNHQI